MILSFLGVDISADTVDNILKNVKIKDNPNVEKIGIDDVAIRKGLKYATAIYDLETHHLIALLEGREKDDIIPWLKEHQNIKVVVRDRASAYADAVNEVLPSAIQIADRFHLFENIIGYLKDIFYSEIPDKIVIKDNKILDKKATKVLKELSNIDEKILNDLSYTNESPINENGEIIKFIDYQYDMNDKLHKNQANNRFKNYELAKNIRHDFKKNSKLDFEELSIQYNISTYKVKKYINMSEEEVEQIKEKKNYKRKKNTLDDYKNIIFKMLKDNHPVEYIIAYILKISDEKVKSMNVKNYIYTIAKNNNIRDIPLNVYNKFKYSSDEIVITRRDLLKYILTIDEKKSKNKKIEEDLEILINKFPIVKKIQIIFKDFHDVIFSNDPNTLDYFIKSYKDDLPSFCKGLKKDIVPVKNAISYNMLSTGG